MANKNKNGGLDYATKIDNEIAKDSDLITLPKGIAGTNCGNCSFFSKDFCNHKEIQLPVNNRMCCALWDSKGALRSWRSWIWRSKPFIV